MANKPKYMCVIMPPSHAFRNVASQIHNIGINNQFHMTLYTIALILSNVANSYVHNPQSALLAPLCYKNMIVVRASQMAGVNTVYITVCNISTHSVYAVVGGKTRSAVRSFLSLVL